MSTKNDILAFLEKHSPVTIQHISHALRLTKADIRFHLNGLIHSGNVTRIETKYQDGPGRPACQYCLTTQPPETVYQVIIEVLLDISLNKQIEEQQKRSLAEKIVASVFRDFSVTGTSATRLNAKAQYLESYGIKIHWEAAKNGPSIAILREPFSQILKDTELSSLVRNKIIDSLKNLTSD